MPWPAGRCAERRSSRKSPQWAEQAVVRRARRRIVGATATTITLLVTLVGAIAYTVTTHAQDERVRREVRYVAEHGDPARPPACAWLFAPRAGSATTLPAAPAGFPLEEDLRRVRGTGEPVERTVRRDGSRYLVRTQTRDDGQVVQAVFDLRFQLADRDSLWTALGVAEGVGLIAALGTGVVLGCRAVTPLAEALARQRRFVADASHELRTPITQVHTRAQLLARRARTEGLPAAHREGLALLVGSLGRLGEVLDDLLSSAALSAGRAPRASLRRVDLAALTREAAGEETVRALQAGLALRVSAPPWPLWVDGVPSALRRAVGELLANALAHTPRGGRIEVSLKSAEGWAELTVADTGAGFEAGEAERLFRRFQRGGNGRYGLGLALLREVVTGHGGTVSATGRPGRGARFTLRLPLGRADVPSGGAAAPAGGARAPAAAAAGPLPPAGPGAVSAARVDRLFRASWRMWRGAVPLSGRRRPVGGPGRPGGSRS